MQAPVIGRENLQARVAAHLGNPEIAEVGKARRLIGRANHFVKVERVRNREGGGEIGRARMNAIRDHAGPFRAFGYAGRNRFKPALANVHDADAEWRTDPFVHVEADKVSAKVVHGKVQLPPGMGRIHNAVDTVFTCDGDDLADRHDEARTVADMREQEEADLWIGGQGIGIEGDQFVVRDGFGNGQTHD